LFFAKNLFKKIPKTIKKIVPIITGISKKSNDAELVIMIIGLPPAGGWVTSNKIINATPKLTANGIVIAIGRGTKLKKAIPIKDVKTCPKNIFFGLENGLSG
tara:strand:+ start:88 stop:393 length:306 start_codon:yes stop_codon:yes gene_type:complete